MDCPKCQANLCVPYKFQCSECSFKSYRDFQRCPRCGSVGPGLLGDRVRKKKKWMERLFLTLMILISAFFLLSIYYEIRNQVIGAREAGVRRNLSIVKDLIARGEDLEAWEGLWELQETARKMEYREEEIKRIMEALEPKVMEIMLQKRIAEEKVKEEVRHLIRRAEGMIKDGNYQSAIDTCKKILEIDKGNRKALRLMARVERKMIVRKRFKATISGGAWVVKGDGRSDILRGSSIALLEFNEEMISKIVALRKESRERWPTIPFTVLGHDIRRISRIVAPHVIKLTRTNIGGKYEIKDVRGGKYLLYAYYKTSFNVAYWLIPVRVESNEPIEINFANFNMTELYSK